MRELGLLVLFILSLSSCKYEEVYQKYLDLADTKKEIASLVGELEEDELRIIGSYFVTLKDLGFQVKFDKKMKKRLNKKFDKYFDAKECDEMFLSKKEYESILKSCNANGFFICAEESKYYVEILKEFKKNLERDKVDNVLSDSVCKKKIKDLGV